MISVGLSLSWETPMPTDYPYPGSDNTWEHSFCHCGCFIPNCSECFPHMRTVRHAD